ncbi:hypothetical protein OL239_14825 [Arthrobacter sp. ATA002]|uniref:hypothetical protein n=1 Tax=Arthrobacter sp. ATA002 TaxID=2991715 RepID=UPI0022A779FF|nr:hypothetical protein [Arthrobacter sp. ATA002]WAP51141.1 hypothetical protein OL239_14825 [Arthrobacter sp. ATA002]
MKNLRVLKAAGLIVAAVVLGLMTVQGSYALWNAVVPSNAATIQAADFRVKVGPTLMTPGQQFNLPAVTLSTANNASVSPVSVAGAVNVTSESPFLSTTTVKVNPVTPPLVAGVATAVSGTCPADPAAYKASAATPPQKPMWNRSSASARR